MTEKLSAGQGFQPDIVGAARHRAFDAGREQLLEGGKKDVLQIDGKGQQPVEEWS